MYLEFTCFFSSTGLHLVCGDGCGWIDCSCFLGGPIHPLKQTNISVVVVVKIEIVSRSHHLLFSPHTLCSLVEFRAESPKMSTFTGPNSYTAYSRRQEKVSSDISRRVIQPAVLSKSYAPRCCQR
jgi:hypothetical protein